MKIYTILFLSSLISVAGVLHGCAGTQNVGSKYGCVNLGSCSLPEEINSRQALIYLIRPYRIFNQDEKHDLYITEGREGEIHYARIFGSTYCAIKTYETELRLRVSGYLNDSETTLQLEHGKVYYVLLDTSLSFFNTRLIVGLKRVNENEGEKLLMEDVTSSCSLEE